MVIINSIICPSHTGNFEEDEESDSADREESEVFHCDGDHDLHRFADFLFHGLSPCVVRVGISEISCHPISYFELNISHNTAI